MSVYLSSTSIMKPSIPPWLEEICQRIAENDRSMTIVELTHPRIDDVGARVLAKALEENNHVGLLTISFFNIVDEGAYLLGRVLGDPSFTASRTIKKLQFRELRVSRDFLTLIESLITNSGLEELSFRHSRVCLRGAAALEKLLKSHGQLQELRLVDTQLASGALHHVCSGVANSRTIKRLHLINTELNELDAEHLSRMLQNESCDLSELHLAENDLGDAGVAVLALGLKANSTLQLLDLRSNGITENGALSIQGVLVSSTSLLCLRLGNNAMGTRGAHAVARGLTYRNSSLRKIDLSANEIVGPGAGALAHMIRYNTNLIELNLSFNQIGDTGAQALANGLTRNQTLKWLSLKRNHITNEGAGAIACKLPKMQGLQHLILSKNTIGTEGASLLLEGLRSNVELEYLHLDDGRSSSVHTEIKHWIRLNKAGRRIFRHSNVPQTLWPVVYGRITSDSDVLFHFLTEKPEVI